jgi:extradiol dioxygenase family protein
MAKVTIRFNETTPQQRTKMIRDLGNQLDVNESLESLIATMQVFEGKYGMSTVEFYARFAAGKMGDSRDFIKWAGAFDLYHHLLETHFHRQSEAA